MARKKRQQVHPELRKRLLLDIAEMQNEPYPNICFHLVDDTLKEACLVLNTDQGTIHLTVQFGRLYPLSPPRVRVGGKIGHPNVSGRYICASILSDREHYSSAYTIKSIAINLLSFFASENIEQETYGLAPPSSLDIQTSAVSARGDKSFGKTYECRHCSLGTSDEGHFDWKDNLKSPEGLECLSLHDIDNKGDRSAASFPTAINAQNASSQPIKQLPDELLLEILAMLNFQDFVRLSAAWDRVRCLVEDYQVIRSRELQCFVTRRTYRQLSLGIGVDCRGTKIGTFRSEFDLVSRNAFFNLNVRASVYGQRFQYWLPLPLSHGHWRGVKDEATTQLHHMGLKMSQGKPGAAPDNAAVLFTFMNDIIVRLNTDLEGIQHQFEYRKILTGTLLHSSEKAIESYYHLFHLLLCLATEDTRLIFKANDMVTSFLAGKTSKADTPSLGHLLVALLISDVEMSDALMTAIIEETVTRNVVWLLDMNPELSYMEREGQASTYRVAKTFTASVTSYRLLMFSELFRRMARPGSTPEPGVTDATSQHAVAGTTTVTKTPLETIRDALFARHGAPPRGAAAHMASQLRHIQSVSSFPEFMGFMGVRPVSGAGELSGFLRGAVRASMVKGYSRWALEQEEALVLRYEAMGLCEEAEGLPARPRGGLEYYVAKARRASWFPGGD